jgi:hypothetical protein
MLIGNTLHESGYGMKAPAYVARDSGEGDVRGADTIDSTPGHDDLDEATAVIPKAKREVSLSYVKAKASVLHGAVLEANDLAKAANLAFQLMPAPHDIISELQVTRALKDPNQPLAGIKRESELKGNCGKQKIFFSYIFQEVSIIHA